MKKQIYFLLIFSLIFGGTFVFAQTNDPFSNLVYPIPELGNCQSKEDCKIYCDKAENMEPCVNYAEAHSLLPGEDIEMARKLIAVGETTGPGGCIGQQECKIYCDNIDHLEECIEFGKKHGLIPPEELKETEKVLQAIKKGVTPPNCSGKTECDIYCSQPEHMEECIAFGEAAGLISGKELEDSKKVLQVIEKGINPPPCRGDGECDVYCSEPEHFEECIAFAEAAGFMSSEEAEKARKTGGVGPGGCRNEEECKAFCDNPDNFEECIDFAVKVGDMTPEEAEELKEMSKMGTMKGPGGCESEEECKTFCENPDNFEECIDFAVQSGQMTEEEAYRMKIEARMREHEGMEPQGFPAEEMYQEMPEEKMIQEGMPVPEGEMFKEGMPAMPEKEMLPEKEMMEMKEGVSHEESNIIDKEKTKEMIIPNEPQIIIEESVEEPQEVIDDSGNQEESIQESSEEPSGETVPLSEEPQGFIDTVEKLFASIIALFGF